MLFELYNAFRKGLDKLIPSLFSFIKKLFGLLFYLLPATIPTGIAFLVMWGLRYLDVNLDISRLVMKIIFSIGQIIPLSVYIHLANNENHYDDYSSDLGFAFCAIAIAWMWTL